MNISADKISEIKAVLEKVRSTERFKLVRQFNNLRKKNENKASDWENLRKKIENSIQIRQKRLDNRPDCHFDDELPINQHRENITEALQNSQVVIICGETGSGKTTQLPKLCLELGRGVDGYIGHATEKDCSKNSRETHSR